MIKELNSIIIDYGWVALILFVVVSLLFRYVSTKITIWKKRNDDSSLLDKQEMLTHHQFFGNTKLRWANAITTMKFNPSQPVRQKMFRVLLELKLKTLDEVASIAIGKILPDNTPARWALSTNLEVHKADLRFEQYALQAGIPPMVITKFLGWQIESVELLTGYINDLAMSPFFESNFSRNATLMYVLGLQIVVVLGDAEKKLAAINGEFTGLHFNGELLE